MKNRGIRASLLLSILVSVQGARGEDLPVCFIPGVGGMTPYLHDDLPQGLASRGFRFKAYDVAVKGGDIAAKARRFKFALEEELRKDPSFRCNGMSHSMGGIIGRYALAHLEVEHPTLGRRPLREFMPTFTTISTPHRGTPFGEIFHRYFPKLDPSSAEMSEAMIELFNDPNYPETYSPEMPGVSYFSYRSFLNQAKESVNVWEYLGFSLLWFDLLAKKRDPLNDGVIPFDSQGFGRILGDLRVPHAYFADRTSVQPPAIDFYEGHLRFLRSLTESER